jgi:hypothetical protein
VHGFAADLLACDPQAAMVVLGDLNDVPGSKTLKLLKGECFITCWTICRRVRATPGGTAATAGAGSYSGQSAYYGAAQPCASRMCTATLRPVDRMPASDHDPVVAILPDWIEEGKSSTK